MIGFRVPFSLEGFPKAYHFVPRADNMGLLEALLQSSDDETRRRVPVVNRMGGIGKTQRGIEDSWKHKDGLNAIFGLDESSKDAVRQSLADAALDLPGTSKFGGSSTSRNADDVDQ